MIQPTRLPIQSTYEPSAFQRQITLEESTDTKVELNNIIFHNTQKKCNDIRSFLLKPVTLLVFELGATFYLMLHDAVFIYKLNSIIVDCGIKHCVC